MNWQTCSGYYADASIGVTHCFPDQLPVDDITLTDVIAVISNCPQRYNPAAGYNPTPVRVETWQAARQPAISRA